MHACHNYIMAVAVKIKPRIHDDPGFVFIDVYSLLSE